MLILKIQYTDSRIILIADSWCEHSIASTCSQRNVWTLNSSRGAWGCKIITWKHRCKNLRWAATQISWSKTSRSTFSQSLRRHEPALCSAILESKKNYNYKIPYFQKIKNKNPIKGQYSERDEYTISVSLFFFFQLKKEGRGISRNSKWLKFDYEIFDSNVKGSFKRNNGN